VPAKAVYVKCSAITTYESGFAEPKLNVVVALSVYFGIDIEQLLSANTGDLVLDQIFHDPIDQPGKAIFSTQLAQFISAIHEI
jgi:hypothetical protein